MDRTEPSQQPERGTYHLFTPPAGETDDTARKRAWKGDSFSFRDLIDIVNPLQHLPIVSTLYRWVTGDAIGALPRIIGDGIYGGPIGLVTGLFNAQIKQESGKDAGEHLIALLGGGEPPTPDTAPLTVAGKDAGQSGGTPQPADAAPSEGGATVAAVGGTVSAASAARNSRQQGYGRGAGLGWIRNAGRGDGRTCINADRGRLITTCVRNRSWRRRPCDCDIRGIADQSGELL